MNIQKALYLIVILIIVCSCTNKTINGNGVVIQQVRELKGFNRINVNGSFKVFLAKADSAKFTIVADSNLMAVINTKVVDSVLIVENLQTILTSKELKLIVTCPNLKSIDFTGATEIEGDSGLVYKSLTLNISGAGKILLNLQTDSLKANISGGANIILSGKTQNLDISISGAGKVGAKKFESKSAKMEILGLGEAELNVTEKLNATISGLGKIEYIGDPEVHQNILGGGKVVKK